MTAPTSFFSLFGAQKSAGIVILLSLFGILLSILAVFVHLPIQKGVRFWVQLLQPSDRLRE